MQFVVSFGTGFLIDAESKDEAITLAIAEFGELYGEDIVNGFSIAADPAISVC